MRAAGGDVARLRRDDVRLCRSLGDAALLGGVPEPRLLVLAHALLEAFDALGDIAHHLRKAALAEQEEEHHQRRSANARC
jgi:hypothetical protein